MLGEQVLLLTVQRNVLVAPGVKPVTFVVAALGLLIVPPPETTVHIPVPTAGVVALRVTVVMPHNVWSAPALDVEGDGSIVITTSFVDGAHVPLEMLH